MCEGTCSYSLLVTCATSTSTAETLEVRFNRLYTADKAFSRIQSEMKSGSKVYIEVIKLY